MNQSELKNSVMKLIKDDNYDIEDFKSFLNPIDKYTNNQTFINNLHEIINVLLEDRDGNNKFTIDDLKLIKDDMFAISSLLNGLLLVICVIPQLKLKYNKGATEELVFKLLAYIFIVVIPKEIGRPWTLKEKEDIVKITIQIYQLILSSQVTKDIINNIIKWFKKKGWCKCTTGSKEEINQRVIKKKLPKIKADMGTYIKREKMVNKLNNELFELKEQITKLSGDRGDKSHKKTAIVKVNIHDSDKEQEDIIN